MAGPVTEVAVVALVRDGGVLLQRRLRAPGAGLWELPGGKVQPGEGPEDAARREAREELGVDVRIVRALGVHEHQYPGGPHVRLHAFLAEAVGEVAPHEARRWVPLPELPGLDVLAGTRPILGALARPASLAER
ncbi:MAG: NUDIX domain-containing protein [Halobacteriales archaeon]|nr:NUDIX domain-containing protein [Halobacteriales archaeon]